jgi:hypothetical protein
MTQALYAHMNNKTIKKRKRKRNAAGFCVLILYPDNLLNVL